MSLIKCIECGKEFSDKANACPNCACPIEFADRFHNLTHLLSQYIELETNSKNSKLPSKRDESFFKQLECKHKISEVKQKIKNELNNIEKERIKINNKELIIKLMHEQSSEIGEKDVFKYISDELKNDKDVILSATKYSIEIPDDIAINFSNNRNYIIEIINSGGEVLQYASDKIKNDKEIVLKALENGGRQLQYVSDELKNDKEVVLVAVKKYGNALIFASDKLRNDKEVVLEAVKNSYFALKYANPSFKNDKEIVSEAVKCNYRALDYANPSFKNDKDFIRKISKTKMGTFILCGVSDDLRKDKDFIIELYKENYSIVYGIADELKDDEDFMLYLGSINGKGLEYSSERLKKDENFVNKAAMYSEEFENESAKLFFFKDHSNLKNIYSSQKSSIEINKSKCPSCGSSNVIKIGAMNRAVSVGLWGLASSKIGKTMQCNSCGYKW